MSTENTLPITHHVLSSIGHDLRSPLNAVIGFSRIMVKGLDGPLSEMQSNDLQAIYENGQMMLDMVNDLIDLAKIEAGGSLLGETTVYLEPVIEKAVGLIQPQLKDKAVEIVSQVKADALSLRADEYHIQRILLGMLQAIVAFVPAGKVMLTAERDGQEVMVQAHGLAEEQLAGETPFVLEAVRSQGQSMEHRVTALSLKMLLAEKWVALYGGTFWIADPKDSEIRLGFHLPMIPSQT